MKVIAAYCNQELQGKMLDVFTFAVEPKAKNYKEIAVAPDGLKVLFDACSATPCAQGSHNVLVPFDKVKEMLKPQSQVAKIASEKVVKD